MQNALYKVCFETFKIILARFCKLSGSQKFNLFSGPEQSQSFWGFTWQSVEGEFHLKKSLCFLHIGDQKSFCLVHILFRHWILVLFYCSFAYSQTRSSVLPKNQGLVFWFKIWIRSSFELLKLISKDGLLESSLYLNNQFWLEYRTIVVVSWTLEDVTKCVWPCLRTWKASLDLYSSARIDYISFQRRFFESGNCKRVAVTSPSVGKILEHFRIYGTAIPSYSHGDS